MINSSNLYPADKKFIINHIPTNTKRIFITSNTLKVQILLIVLTLNIFFITMVFTAYIYLKKLDGPYFEDQFNLNFGKV